MDQVRMTQPDSAIYLYRQAYKHYLEKKDTLSAVNALVEMAVVYGHQAKYQSVYDQLWKALLLADEAQNDQAKITTYIHLGRYHSFYKRKEKAIQYFQEALNTSKSLVQKGLLKSSDLTHCYYALSSTYSELDDPQNSQKYLDSCLVYGDPVANPGMSYYLQTQKAILLNKQGKASEALEILFMAQQWFAKQSPGFQVLLFTHIGDAYLSQNERSKAENYYLKAIDASKLYKSHLDFVPTIHERLWNLYLQKDNFQKAALSLQKERTLNLKFFDSRSENNRSLLEIKDEFRLEKEKQQQLIQEQRMLQLELEERAAFLKFIIVLITLIFLIFSGLLYFNYVRNKYRSEKELIKKKKELEVKQTQELLELKNKELATSSLKLIEKDEVLATLKERLSKGNGDIKANELKKIVRSISHSNAQNWEDFEARFISVNKNFYDTLNKQYPKLSRGDQKLCALVKLNLSSKEMAKLLGISVESVHTNRYRLRKKLGLSRDTSLTEFIATL